MASRKGDVGITGAFAFDIAHSGKTGKQRNPSVGGAFQCAKSLRLGKQGSARSLGDRRTSGPSDEYGSQ